MNIEKKHIQSKKVIGTMAGRNVTEIVTKGGFHLVTADKGGSFEVLGTGPHRAVARHIAEKRAQAEIKWTELSKSDHVDFADYEFLLPRYEAMTDYMRSMQDE